MKRWLCTLIACTLLLCGTLVDGKAVRDGGDGKKPYIILSQGGVGVQKLKDILGKFNIPIDKVVQQPTTPNGASAVVVQLPPSIAQSVLSQPDVAATEEVHTFTAPPSPVSDPTSGTSTAGFSLTLSNTDGALTGDWASYAAVAVGNLSCAPWHLDRLDQTVLPLDCIYGYVHTLMLYVVCASESEKCMYARACTSPLNFVSLFVFVSILFFLSLFFFLVSLFFILLLSCFLFFFLWREGGGTKFVEMYHLYSQGFIGQNKGQVQKQTMRLNTFSDRLMPLSGRLPLAMSQLTTPHLAQWRRYWQWRRRVCS